MIELKIENISVTVEVIGMIRFSFIYDVTFFYDRTEIEKTSVMVEVIGMIRFSFILDVTFFYDRTENREYKCYG